MAGLAVLFPVCWVIFALARGELINFYAYPFLNVTDLGYPRVLINVALVGVLFFAVGSVAVARDPRRPAVGDKRVATPTRRD